jgi:hypothetical protein
MYMSFSLFTSLLQIYYLMPVYHSKFVPPSSRMSFSTSSTVPIFVFLTAFVCVYSLLLILFLSHYREILDEMSSVRYETFIVATTMVLIVVATMKVSYL